MAGTRIYGQLIRAQLELLASNPSSATGLMYFNTVDSLVTVHDGTGWKKLVTSASIADLSILPIITPAKGGLGADASAWTGILKVASGVFSASALTSSDLPVVPASKGGTGIANNDLATLTRVGNHALTLTTSAATNVTLPVSGTLSTLDGTETLLNKSISSTAALTGAIKLPVGNSTTERPTGTASQLKGMVRYNDTDDVFEGYNEVGGWSSIGGGGTTDRITQASHGFVVGDVLYLNGSTYAKAKADAANTAEVVGVVSKIIDASQFELTLSGEVSGLTGLVAGEVYFLSAATAGALTVTEPTVVGQVSLPIGVASSTTSLYVAPKRGSVVGSSNARTQIALANAATTTVQDISAYDAGELTGWVSIVNTTAANSLRFYVAAQFSKNGAANNYNVSYQVSGDTPPVGFSVTATAAGLLQVTLPSVTGFASASINYALNAPAVGTAFPLSVSARNVLGDTTGTVVPSGYVGQRLVNTVSVTGQASGTVTVTNASVELTPGIWQVYVVGVGKTVGPTYVQVAIANISNSQIVDSDGVDPNTFYAGASSQAVSGTTPPVIFRVSSTTTYKSWVRVSFPSSGGAIDSTIAAIRIA